MEQVSVSFTWESAGDLSVDSNHKLVFPKSNRIPCLYRFTYTATHGTAAYIGETEDLYRRLQHYRNPGPTQRTNQRLNSLLADILLAGERVSLATVSKSAFIEASGRKRPVDLSQKHERVLLEHAALYDAAAKGLTILNL